MADVLDFGLTTPSLQSLGASAEDDFRAAQQSYDRGEFEGAIARVSRAIMLNAREAKYYKLRGRAAAKTRRVYEAMADLRYAVMRERGKDATARHDLAALLFEYASTALAGGGVEREAVAFGLKRERERCAVLEEACTLDPLAPAYCVARAEAHEAAGDLNGALAHASRAVDLDEGAAEARPHVARARVFVLRARVHRALGHGDAAHADMLQATDFAPELAECRAHADATLLRSAELYSKAAAWMRDRNFKEARDLLTKVMLANIDGPTDVKFLVTRASCHRQLGDFPKALGDLKAASDLYRAAFDVQPEPSPATRKKKKKKKTKTTTTPGDDSGDDDSDDESGEEYSMLRREPFQVIRQRDLCHSEMGLEAMARGDLEAALTYLNRCIAGEVALADRGDCALDHRFYLNRGDCHQARGELDLASADFHTAKQLLLPAGGRQKNEDGAVEARLATLRYAQGARLFNEGDFTAAEVEFTRAIAQMGSGGGGPGLGRLYAARGEASYFTHRFDAACADFREALRLDPTLDDVRVKLLQFEPNGGDLDNNKKNKPQPPDRQPQTTRNKNVPHPLFAGSTRHFANFAPLEAPKRRAHNKSSAALLLVGGGGGDGGGTTARRRGPPHHDHLPVLKQQESLARLQTNQSKLDTLRALKNDNGRDRQLWSLLESTTGVAKPRASSSLGRQRPQKES